MIASPRTDSIEDRAEEERSDDSKSEVREITLPNEIIQDFGLIESDDSDEVTEEGILTQGDEDIFKFRFEFTGGTEE